MRYPHQLNLPTDHKCVLEKDGGILIATKAVSVIQVYTHMLYTVLIRFKGTPSVGMPSFIMPIIYTTIIKSNILVHYFRIF